MRRLRRVFAGASALFYLCVAAPTLQAQFPCPEIVSDCNANGSPDSCDVPHLRFPRGRSLRLSFFLSPSDLVLEDLNDDGALDAVFAGGNTGAAISYNDGSGGFAAPQSLNGRPTDAVAVADLDGDGASDVVTADFAPTQLVIYWNDGKGQLSAGIPIELGAVPTSVAVAQIDGENGLDVVVTQDENPDTVWILLQAETRTFAPPIVVPVGLNPSDVLAAPLDEDDDLDIVVVNGGVLSGGSVSIVENTGATFAARPEIELGPRPTSAALGDFDGDGDLDLAVLTFDAISILRNDGALSFSIEDELLLVEPVRGIAVADVDRDGNVDLVVGTRAGSRAGVISVWRGRGDRTFTTPIFYDLPVTSDVSPIPAAVAIGDLDLDDDLDVLSASNSSPKTLDVLQNEGDGSLFAPIAIPAGEGAGPVVAADFDGDRAPDLAVAARGSEEVLVLRNIGRGTFSVTATLPLPDVPAGLLSDDLDDDGDVDLVVTLNTDRQLLTFLNDGDGRAFLDGPRWPVGIHAEALAAGDLTGDGLPDLCAAGAQGQDVEIARNLGGGKFAQPVAVDVGTSVRRLIVADLDQDGRQDLVAGGDGLIVLWNEDDLTFETARLSLTSDARSLVAVDLDSDTHLDVVFGNGGLNGSLGAFMNRDGRVFDPQRSLASCTGPSEVTAADIDRDGAPDLLSVCRSEAIGLLHGDGSGRLERSTLTFVKPDPRFLATADFDSDGAIDVAATTAFGGSEGDLQYVRIFLNQASEPVSRDCDANGSPDECDPDSDGDGTIDACDLCEGADDRVDGDEDGVPDCLDNCVDEPNEDQQDTDGDLVGDLCDGCPIDPGKTVPGRCGCGLPEADSDLDGTLDCLDLCPLDPLKVDPGLCGCSFADTDSDGDGSPDCSDFCSEDPFKTEAGDCGCGFSDDDVDQDGTPDCLPNPTPTEGTRPPSPTPTPTATRPPATFTVDALEDAVDAKPGDGVCATASGACTLRAAVQESNLLRGYDVILLPEGIYELVLPGQGEDASATGDLDLTDDVGIFAVNETQVIIDGGGIDRIFEVHTDVRVLMTGLILRNGVDPGISATNRRAAGGILNFGSLSLRRCVLTENRGGGGGSPAPNGGAGALANFGSATLIATSLENNSGQTAGGIVNFGSLLVKDGVLLNRNGNRASALWNLRDARLIRTTVGSLGAQSSAVILNGSGSLELTDCDVTAAFSSSGLQSLERGHATVTRTTITGSGAVENEGTMEASDSTFHGDGFISGGLINSGSFTANRTTVVGGVMNEGEIELENCTVSGPGLNGAIDNRGGLVLDSVTIFNEADRIGRGGLINQFTGTVVMRNSILAGSDGQDGDCKGMIESAGYNLVANVAGCSISGDTEHDLIGVDPLLGLLLDNGGHGPTHALLSGSPLVDRIPASSCPATDQRGVLRPSGTACDGGAYEVLQGCGDGIITPREACDDGNLEGGDCCSSICQLEPALFAGDAGCNGDVSAADLPAVMNALATGERAPCGFDDADGNCSLDTADVGAVVRAIFAFPR